MVIFCPISNNFGWHLFQDEREFVNTVIITFDMRKCNFSFVVISLDTFSSLQVLKTLLSLLVIDLLFQELFFLQNNSGHSF